MPEEISISSSSAEADAQAMSGLSRYLCAAALIPADSASTITANGKCQTAFAKAQSEISVFGETMEQEAANIRSVNLAFSEYDELISTLMESGGRVPVITAPTEVEAHEGGGRCRS